MKRHISKNLILVLMLSACATSIAAGPSDEERGRLSTHMVNLSSAVDTYFAGLSEVPTDNDADILNKATEHDSRLLAPEFKSYLLKPQYQSPYAVLLLCSKDGRQAIMEDAGCSASIDRQVTYDAPCEFTLHVTEGCLVEGAD